MDHGHLVRWDASKWAVHILLLGITDLQCDRASVPPSAPPFLSPAGPYQNLAHLKLEIQACVLVFNTHAQTKNNQ